MRQFIYKQARPLALAWSLMVFALCAVPGRYIPSASWMELLSFDKLVHGGMFFVLCGLLLINASGRKGYTVPGWFLATLCVIYGAGLEMMQAFVFVDRSMDYLDAVANGIGALAALVCRGRLVKAVTSANAGKA